MHKNPKVDRFEIVSYQMCQTPPFEIFRILIFWAQNRA